MITLSPEREATFKVVPLDQHGNEMPIETISINDIKWDSTVGSINQSGTFSSKKYQKGEYEITATLGSFSDTAKVTIPAILSQIEINPKKIEHNPEEELTFTVSGLDQVGDFFDITNYPCTWTSTKGGSISRNGVFKGDYQKKKVFVTATVNYLSYTAQVTFSPVLRSLKIYPRFVYFKLGSQQKFFVKGFDQYGQQITPGEVSWEIIQGAGTIDEGRFHAGDKEEIVIIEVTAIDSKTRHSIKKSRKIQVGEESRLTDIIIAPASIILYPGEEEDFHVVPLDQYGKEMSIDIEDITWSAEPGSITQYGHFESLDTQKGKCKITANVKVYCQKTDTIISFSPETTVTIPPVPRQIEIHPKEIKLNPEEEFKFTVTGVDQAGDPLEKINSHWTTTNGASITAQGVFKGYYKEREVIVTVTVGHLNKTAKVTFRSVLRRLKITPKFVYLKSGEQQTFLVKGFDQFKKEIDLDDITWKTTGGQIDQDGTLTVPKNHQGYFKVTATSRFTPKHTQKVRKLLIYVWISTQIIKWLISNKTFFEDLLEFSVESTQQQLEPVKENDNSSNILLNEVQSTETIPVNAELVATEESSNIGNDEIIKPEPSTDVLDFSTVLGNWLWEKLENIVARVFRFVSNFCFDEATASLSASADVFVLRVEYNPYKSFECLHILHAHSEIIPALAITPDGQKLISASWDNTIKIWDLNTRSLLNTLEGHTDDVECLAITPDGRMLVSGGWDNTIKIWNLTTNLLLNSLYCSDHIVSIAITSDGQKFISGERSNTITLWNLTRRQPLRSYENDVTKKVTDHPFWWHKCLAVTPDQQKIITGRRRFVQVYDLKTGELLNNIKSHVGWIYALAITPDSQKLIVGHDRIIKIWDLITKSPDVCMTLKSASKEVYALAITPDGKQVVSAGRRIDDDSELEENISGLWIEIWNLETGEKLHSIREEATSDNYVYCLAITPDGKQIISGYADGTIKIWGIPELILQVDD